MAAEEYPLVTVIAACYNHETFAVECLEGIRKQTYPNIQLIITDDCSHDRSVEIIEEWITRNQVKCQFVKHTENVGFPRTLNEALSWAKGEYISIISTDDYWSSGFIENRVKIFTENDEKVGVVYGRTLPIDVDGEEFPYTLPRKSPAPEGNIYKELLRVCFIPAMSTMIRATCYQKVGFYDENLTNEDYDMWLRIADFFDFKFSPDILSIYRIHENSMSNLYRDKVNLSRTQVFFKQLSLKPENKIEIENRIAAHAEVLYKNNHPNYKYYVKIAISRIPSKSSFILYLFAILGIPYSRYEKFKKFFKNTKR